MSDDGFGPYVVRVLEADYECPAGVEFIDVGTPGLDLDAVPAGRDSGDLRRHGVVERGSPERSASTSATRSCGIRRRRAPAARPGAERGAADAWRPRTADPRRRDADRRHSGLDGDRRGALADRPGRRAPRRRRRRRDTDEARGAAAASPQGPDPRPVVVRRRKVPAPRCEVVRTGTAISPGKPRKTRGTRLAMRGITGANLPLRQRRPHPGIGTRGQAHPCPRHGAGGWIPPVGLPRRARQRRDRPRPQRHRRRHDRSLRRSGRDRRLRRASRTRHGAARRGRRRAHRRRDDSFRSRDRILDRAQHRRRRIDASRFRRTCRPVPSASPRSTIRADRRYRYPFTNCTNCGPRFTIVHAAPYDRAETTMAAFTMCAGVPARVRRSRRTAAFTRSRTPVPACGPRARPPRRRRHADSRRRSDRRPPRARFATG